tara:strand:- start:1460 stop:2068 length:609 start_codon:yes stop_codon:yes gene_type:complete
MSRTSRSVHLPNFVDADTLKVFKDTIKPDMWQDATSVADIKGYSSTGKCYNLRQYIHLKTHSQSAHDKLYSKLFNIVKGINEDHWNFDIKSFDNNDSVHYVLYKGDKNHHFDWHRDDLVSFDKGKRSYGPTAARKLTIMVCLSNSNDYAGGEFQVDAEYNGGTRPGLGDVIVWPGYVRHRCTPVTSGERLVLVGFVPGPNFV